MTDEQVNNWTAWKRTQDPKYMSALLKSLEPTVTSAIRSYGENNPALRTRAFILAREAVDTYDPTQKAALNTHVMNTLKRLYRVQAERKLAVHVPENVRLDNLHVQTYITDYKDRYGQEPSQLQIADALRFSRKRVTKALSSGETPESLLQGEKGESIITADDKGEEDIWRDYVYHDLDDTNRKVFEWTTGYGNTPTIRKTEIAKKLNISPAAVSQRINTIQKKLNMLNELPDNGPSI